MEGVGDRRRVSRIPVPCRMVVVLVLELVRFR
jgi:hypothetical protein